MVDVFEAMLRGAVDSLNRGDRKRVAETARMDTLLDRLDTAMKEYLTSIDSDALDDIDHRRSSEILASTTNLEHASDIVEKILMPPTRSSRGAASCCRAGSSKTFDRQGGEWPAWLAAGSSW
jgi:Na+/phosphate symporter